MRVSSLCGYNGPVCRKIGFRFDSRRGTRRRGGGGLCAKLQTIQNLINVELEAAVGHATCFKELTPAVCVQKRGGRKLARRVLTSIWDYSLAIASKGALSAAAKGTV
jgi:hypothetical protein